MKRNSTMLLALMAVLVLVWGCSNNDDSGPADPSGPGMPTGYGTVSGLVKDTFGAPLAGVAVAVGGVAATTDAEGAFTATDVPAGERTVDLRLAGYAANFRPAAVTDGGVIHLPRILLMAVETVVINGAAGGVAATGDGRAWVEFPAGAFVTGDGDPYTGDVTVELCAAHPEHDGFTGVFPGPYEGVQADGEAVPIQSFGFMDVKIFGSGRTPLALADGATADLSLDVGTAKVDDPPATIPMWYFDEDTGRWLEDGEATLNGTVYVGTVSHFTSWNYDRIASGANLCWVEGYVRDTAGQPVAGVAVRAVAVGRGFGGGAVTDSTGAFLVRGLRGAATEVWGTLGILMSESEMTILLDCPTIVDLTVDLFVPAFEIDLAWDGTGRQVHANFYIPFPWDDGEIPDHDWWWLGPINSGYLGTAPYAELQPQQPGAGNVDIIYGLQFTPGVSEYWVSPMVFSGVVDDMIDQHATVEFFIAGNHWEFDVADVPDAGSAAADSWWHVFNVETDPDGSSTMVPVMEFKAPRSTDGVFPEGGIDL
ncbi:MAG: carboxypeptidase regulatory-like domain-containing protein [bacterium]|nr:carboxypeptidase regulatory-like domain-containing protein [bacterium]